MRFGHLCKQVCGMLLTCHYFVIIFPREEEKRIKTCIMRAKSLILIYCAVAAMLSVSCQKKEYLLDLDRSVINLEATGNDPEVVVVTARNVDWTVNVDEASKEWLIAGNTGDKIYITALDRTVESPRVGRIVVRTMGDVAPAKEIIVTQKGAAGLVYSLSVSPRSLLFAAGETAESKKVFVDAKNTGWSAEVDEPAREWLLITAGQDEITVKVREKTDIGSRTGRIVVRPEKESLQSQTVTVTQTGINVTFSVSPTELNFGAEDTVSKMITITAENVTWNSIVQESARGWLKISSSGNIINVSVEPNPDDTPRVGRIIITPDMEGIAAKEVIVTQSSITGQYDAVFTGGVGEYYGDYYENGCGNFDMKMVSGDLVMTDKGVAKGMNGYYFFCENFSDLAAGDVLRMTPEEYEIVDTEEKYTALPGYFDDETKQYVSARLQKFENGRITSINSVVSGSFRLEFDGVYTIGFSLVLDDGTEKSFYYKGGLEFADKTGAETASGAGAGDIKAITTR